LTKSHTLPNIWWNWQWKQLQTTELYKYDFPIHISHAPGSQNAPRFHIYTCMCANTRLQIRAAHLPVIPIREVIIKRYYSTHMFMYTFLYVQKYSMSQQNRSYIICVYCITFCTLTTFTSVYYWYLKFINNFHIVYQ
jgi:hypothetical protein